MNRIYCSLHQPFPVCVTQGCNRVQKPLGDEKWSYADYLAGKYRWRPYLLPPRWRAPQPAP